MSIKALTYLLLLYAGLMELREAFGVWFITAKAYQFRISVSGERRSQVTQTYTVILQKRLTVFLVAMLIDHLMH